VVADPWTCLAEYAKSPFGLVCLMEYVRREEVAGRRFGRLAEREYRLAERERLSESRGQRYCTAVVAGTCGYNSIGVLMSRLTMLYETGSRHRALQSPAVGALLVPS